MSASRLNHEAIIYQLMVDKDVDGAIQAIVNILQHKSNRQIEMAFTNIRRSILRKHHYMNKTGYGELVSLSIDPSLNADDQLKLKNLLLRPLHNIHWCQQHSRFLKCPVASKKFRSIKLVVDPFYEFVCPEAIKALAVDDRKKDKIAHNKHEKRPRETYHFTTHEIEEMIQQAYHYILQADKCTRRMHYTMMLDALSLVSGRRKWELSCTLKVKSVPDKEYQACVTGICKNLNFEEKWIIIPLLIPFNDFVVGLVKLRAYPNIALGKYYGKRLFPNKLMTHTHFRNVYINTAFTKRLTQNYFLIGNESCGPAYWRSQALGTDLKNSSEIYDVMCIDQDESTHDVNVCLQQQTTSPLSDPISGSREHLLQNSL